VKLLVTSPKAGSPRSILAELSFGFPSFTTVSLPERVFTGLDDAARPPSVVHLEPEIDVRLLPTPAASLVAAAGSSNWAADTRRSVARLEALWLLAEDRHHLLDVHEVEPLAHQASLVEHVVTNPDLRRVLIADEVGLGKTVEAALIVQRLQQASNRPLRVLYLTEARLVDNVAEEFERVGIRLRRWTSAVHEARLDPVDGDALVVASMHRAVFRVEGGVDHFKTVSASGPWDVLIVDEAHHLSDWSPGGTDPQERMRLVRHLVAERLKPDGRLILLTGTPHQGHEARFLNVLRLLDDDLEDHRASQGRIIYRIKDDIRDWDGRPLFPLRSVADPTVVEVPDAYREWLDEVHALFTRGADSRAGAWRRAQALQWCASSPEAGLAYLVRVALRSGLDASRNPAVKSALLALRPWRGGPADEGAIALQSRILGSRIVGDEEDPEEDVTSAPLLRALENGTALVREDALACKMKHVLGWLEAAPGEKLVLFAQPVETVYGVRDRLARALGPEMTSLIVGGQDDSTRRAEIQRFQAAGGSRVLISSRSGGEGINLQVSRRLVHFDVPWNPMDMEQRVGRVHRYGSVSSILVHTLVLSGSREERVLARARARLGQIVRDVDRDRFELLFSRTMSLVPLQELEQLMAADGFGPLNAAEGERLDALVKTGFERWHATDREFRTQQAALSSLDRGPLDLGDLTAFVRDRVAARPEAGYRRRVFHDVRPGVEPVLAEEPIEAFRLEDGSVVTLGREGGIGVAGPAGAAAPRRVGLNDAAVATALRRAIGIGAAEEVSGAGSCLVEPSALAELVRTEVIPASHRAGFVLLAYLVRELEPATLARELGVALRCWIFRAGLPEVQLNPRQAAALVRLVRDPRPRRNAPTAAELGAVAHLDERLVASLRKGEPARPVPVVFPIAAVLLEPG
jgi:superfamily II DNA or RNA helicase